MMIVFEGFDKSGKTSIIKEFNKATNYEHVVFDRGPWSCMFFDKVIRGDNYMYCVHQQNAKILSLSIELIVFCMCQKELAIERLSNADEDIPTYFDDYEKNLSTYMELLEKNHYGTDVLFLPTDCTTIKGSVEHILNYINAKKAANKDGVL